MKQIYLFILLCVSQPLWCMRASVSRARPNARASHAMNLAARVVAQRNKMHHTQHDLIRTLSSIAPHKFKSEHIQPIIKALVHLNGMPLLAENKNTLEHSIRVFAQTPGFFPTLERLFVHATTDFNNFKGSLYELEQALKITLKNKGEKVISLNQKVSCPQNVIKKEFDICTTDGLIECKNISWPSNSAHAHYLRTQFEQQNMIVKLLNAQNEHELYFLVSSKERIPNSWCQWFEDQGIAFSW